MDLKILRSIVKAEDVKIKEYKTSTIEAVLFGKRQNEYILEECIKVALNKIEDNKKILLAYLKKVQKKSNKNGQDMSNKKVQRNNEEKLKEYLINMSNNMVQNQEPTKKSKWMPLPPVDKKNKPLKEFISSWSSCVVGGVNYEEANKLYSALPVELKKDKTLQALIDTYIARKDRYFIDVSKLEFH
jgi:hypothetical protein